MQDIVDVFWEEVSATVQSDLAQPPGLLDESGDVMSRQVLGQPGLLTPGVLHAQPSYLGVAGTGTYFCRMAVPFDGEVEGEISFLII